MLVAEAVMDEAAVDEQLTAAEVALLETSEAGPVARFAETYVASEEEVGVGGAAQAVQMSLMTRW